MNPRDQNSDYRVLATLCLITTVAILPFTAVHLLAGNLPMAAVTGTLVLSTGFGGAWIYRHRNQPDQIRRFARVIVLIGNATVFLAILGQQGVTVYWIYPLLFTNFYLLPLGAATLVNILVSILILRVVYGDVPADHFARMALSLPMCIFFGYVFSSAITRQRRELNRLANFDALTGVANRHSLETALTEAQSRLRRYGETTSLIFMDIDHFKPLNDEIGHLKGDEVIREFARLLEGRIRRSDRLFRYGGEEFVIMLPHTGVNAARHLAEALRVAVQDHEFASGKRVTASAGVSEIAGEEAASDWLERADAALYQAKEAGRNRVASNPTPPSEPAGG